ncbi:hypothetical protein KX729_06390 [Rhizobium sp. XQZ8]|uniref:hypothetical protein n=1 Tax=Rhizobium populisoli TaxID=2859785 RepID=UPI001CA55704|nr:hypothetical protein [Rhizobium populisoli]MBW6421065.1 hypothetical protein [Rhizobium populisoli]
MVDPIVPVSGTAASRATQVDRSLSIAEPDNAWVAARQSKITAGLESFQAAVVHGEKHVPHPEHSHDQSHVDPDDRHTHARHEHDPSPESEAAEDAQDSHTLSGESDRIGTTNFDDDTPFGDRSAIL